MDVNENEFESVIVESKWNKRRRFIKGKNKLKKLYEETKNYYGAGAYFDYNKQRIVKYSCNSKYVRKMCNKIFRRKMNRTIRGDYDNIPNGSVYKKYTEYWWSII